MTAFAVPPPGQHPFALHDLVVHSRKNLTRGLVLAAFAHFTVLAGFVLLHHREPAVRLYDGPVTLVPSPPVFVPHVPRALPPPTAAPPAEDGTWEIAEREILFEPPKVPVTNGRAPEGQGDPGGPTRAGDPTAAPPAVAPMEPEEGAFVPFDEAPIPVHRPAPEYPSWARDAGVSGAVLLHVLVDRDGRVRRVSVKRGITGLTEAAQEALRRWTFRPARANGRPVAVWVEIPVEFRLGP